MRCSGRTVKKMFVLTNVNAGRNYVYFRKPVCGPIGDTRYVHCRLYDLTQELDDCFISDGLSEDDEYYADYDADYGNRPVVPIKGAPVELHRDREAMRLTWKRSATKAA